MTTKPLGIQEDGRNTLRLPKYSPYMQGWRWMASSAYVALAELSLRMTIYTGDTIIAASAGTVEADETSDVATFSFTAAELAAGMLRNAVNWEIAQLFLEDGETVKVPIVGGPVFFATSAPIGDGEGGSGSIPFDSVTYDQTTDTLVTISISPPGARGPAGANGDATPGVFNYSADYLPNWIAARDDPDTRPIVAWSGHSLFTGQGAGETANNIDNARNHSVTHYAAETLTALGIAARNTALSGFFSTEALFQQYDTRVSFEAGQWAGTGTGTPINALITQASPNTGPLTWTLDSTDDTMRVAIVTAPGNGVLAISVDGGASQTFNTNAAEGLLIGTIDLGAPGEHEVEFWRVSGGSVSIAYAETWNSASLDAAMLNCATGSTGIVARTGTSKPWSTRNTIDALTPHLVIFTAGFSSLVLDEGTAAELKPVLAEYIDDLQSNNVDVLLFGEYAGALGTAPGYVWEPADEIAIEPYRAMLRELAVEKGCVLIDFISALGGHQQMIAQDYFTPFLTNGRVDRIHGGANVYAAQGQLVANVLAR